MASSLTRLFASTAWAVVIVPGARNVLSECIVLAPRSPLRASCSMSAVGPGDVQFGRLARENDTVLTARRRLARVRECVTTDPCIAFRVAQCRLRRSSRQCRRGARRQRHRSPVTAASCTRRKHRCLALGPSREPPKPPVPQLCQATVAALVTEMPPQAELLAGTDGASGAQRDLERHERGLLFGPEVGPRERDQIGHRRRRASAGAKAARPQSATGWSAPACRSRSSRTWSRPTQGLAHPIDDQLLVDVARGESHGAARHREAEVREYR